MIDARGYSKIFVGMSGGKDSTALALWARFKSGWPLHRITFGFMDTDNEDSLTYAYLAYVSSVLAPARIVTYDPGTGFYDLCYKKHRFPAAKSRFCTEELKIKPKHRLFATWLEQGHTPLNVTGVRAAEAHNSNDRGSATYFDNEVFALSAAERGKLFGDEQKRNYILPICRPIVDWTADQVWNIHREYLDLEAVLQLVEYDPDLEHKGKIIDRMLRDRIPYNPLYAMGASRVGCFPCINSRKAEIRAMALHRPARIDYIRVMESWVGSGRDGADISSFFPIDVAPATFRSKRVVTKAGEVMHVSTIDDVVRWSKTKWGGKEVLPDESPDQPSACRIGADCE